MTDGLRQASAELPCPWAGQRRGPGRSPPPGRHPKRDARPRDRHGKGGPRRVTFDVVIEDEVEKIGEATHDRFIIDGERYTERLKQKSAKV